MSSDREPVRSVSLSQLALRGTAATGVTQILRTGLQVALTVILARLLTPSDFGLVAMVAPVVAFASLFQEFGLQQAVIQSRDISQDQQTRLFWLNIALSTAVAATLAAASPLITVFYGDERVKLLTICWTLPLLMGALGAQHQALLSRHARFVTIASIEAVAVSVGFVAAVAAAWIWQSYWALWVSTVATAAVVTLGAWCTSGWRPGAPWTRASVGPLLHFGANLTGFSFANFFARNLDNVIIARVAGTAALGYYDRAYKLLLFPLQNINQPVTRVMVPLLSRLQSDPARFRRAYIMAAGMVSLVSVPGVAVATACSEDLVRLLLGEAWLPAAGIFSWLGIAGLTQPIHNSTGWIFIAQGKTRQMFLWGLYASSMTVLSFVVGIQWGAIGLAAGYALSGWVLRLPVLYIVLHRVGPVTFWDMILLQLPLTAAAAVTWLAAQGLARHGYAGVELLVITAALSYTLAVLTFCSFAQGRAILSGAANLVVCRKVAVAAT